MLWFAEENQEKVGQTIFMKRQASANVIRSIPNPIDTASARKQ